MNRNNILITQRQYSIIYILSFCLASLAVFKLLPGLWWGAAVLAVLFWCQMVQVKSITVRLKIKTGQLQGANFIVLLAYYVISLGLIYYTLGLSSVSLFFWLVWSTFILTWLSRGQHAAKIISLGAWRDDLNKIFNSPLNLSILLILVYLISYFFANPIIDGSPTPWINIAWPAMFLFLIVTALFIMACLGKHISIINTVLYSLVVVGLVAIKYLLSFGYDTLIHQAALEYITLHTQILPLSPFYIGQYAPEVMIHFFSGWSFVLIERWLVPVLFIIVLILTGRNILKDQGALTKVGLAPILALLLMPGVFMVSSPYAMALVWAICAVSFLYVYLLDQKQAPLIISVLAALASLLTHPFVGLGVLIGVVGGYLYSKTRSPGKAGVILCITCVVSSIGVVACFGIYNWLKGSTLTIADPIYYFNRFTNLFADPIWYVKGLASVGLGGIYFFEKIHFYILMVISIFFCLRHTRKKASLFILGISLSALISAWLFMSSLEVTGYSYGDQVNYSYRLLQTSKWLLWPIVLPALAGFFGWFKNKKIILRGLMVLVLAFFASLSWYLTYPRNDKISHLNVNNIRAIDYQALDFIYQQENGKYGYVVFANQIFGAGAIQKYGFQPYYTSPWGDMFYYSIPMGGELNQRFEKMMNLPKFDPELIYQVLRATKLPRAYFITTDYWPLSPENTQRVKIAASEFWDFNGQVSVYLFKDTK